MFGRRRYWRTKIRAEVECRLPGGVILGELYDLHDGGAFLRPDLAFFRAWHDDVEAILGRIAAHAPVEVTFYLDDGGSLQRAYGIIRWIGASVSHGCAGVGIELFA